MRLVDLVDHLLEILDSDPNFRYFSFDAQTIVLEDYLTIKPHNRARLERYIREGRISVGPWYQLNDEFLTSGEATVRSLLVGHRIAQAFGACQKIGYLPDQFGNISQMPQIFRGFGIDKAIVGRGYQLANDRKMEFLWQSPDGSEVLTSLMAFWYNNAQKFPADPKEALQYTLDLKERMAPQAATSHLLLMNGVDHLEAQRNLGSILPTLQTNLPPDTKIAHALLPDYMNAVRAEVEQKKITLSTHVGELREDRGGSCLAGTLSTRMYLKQANSHAQTLLERHAEPFSAFAMLAGTPYPYDILHYAWKLLMENHPHDSICGCSVDQVHQEMLPRFQQVEQIGEEVVTRSLHALTEQIATPTEGTYIAVFNSLNWERTDPVTMQIVFPLGIPTRGNPPRDDRKQVQGFRLLNPDGKEVAFVVQRVEVRMRTVLSPVELPLDQWVQEYTIEFVAERVPAGGYCTYSVQPCNTMPQFTAKPCKHIALNMLALHDVGEVGDEYLYKPPLNDRDFQLRLFAFIPRQEQKNAILHRAFAKTDWSLPQSATSDAQGRSDITVDCPVIAEKTVYHHAQNEFLSRITIDNRAKDHLLTTSLCSWAKPQSITTEGQYDAIVRPLVPPLSEEGASNFYPQHYWTALEVEIPPEEENGKPELYTHTVVNRGLPAIQVRNASEVHLVLLRCVEYLSRRGDGPQFLTPEAQCLGKHTFEFAVKQTPGNWKEGKVWKFGHRFNVPLRAVAFTGHTTTKANLPLTHSFVSISEDRLIMTALKQAEDSSDTLILRCFNVTDEVIESAIIGVAGASSAHLVNLNEEPEETLEIVKGAVTLTQIRPKQIITLAFRQTKP
jgi:alpha-mannosidase/mannosylglycerate hydrolase